MIEFLRIWYTVFDEIMPWIINITGALAEYVLRQDEQNAKAGKGDEVLVEEVRSLKKIVSEL